mgnify:CR=1 FL=1
MCGLEKVKKEIEDAEIVFGKEQGVTKLIAVSKTKPMDQIKKVIEKGQVHFGENRVQEAISKWEVVKSNRKDYGTQRSIQLMVGKRRKLLTYLATKDILKYRKLVKDLGLRR